MHDAASPPAGIGDAPGDSRSARHGVKRRAAPAALAAGVVVIAILAVTANRAPWRAGTPEARAVSSPDAAEGQVSPQPRAGEAGTGPAPGSWNEVLAREQARAEADARRERDEVLSRYRRESVDARWAAVQEGALQRASTSRQIARTGANPANLDVDCKSSVCRVEADFASRGAAEDWVTLFLLGAGSELPRAVFEHSVNPDRTFHVEITGYARGPAERMAPPPPEDAGPP